MMTVCLALSSGLSAYASRGFMRSCNGLTSIGYLMQALECGLRRAPSRVLACSLPAIGAVSSIYQFVQGEGRLRFPRAVLGINLLGCGVAAAQVFCTISRINNALFVMGILLTVSEAILSIYRQDLGFMDSLRAQQ